MCVNIFQEAMPLRLKEVHIVNQPFLFNMVWQMFKPFVKEKLKKRLFFHGKKMESLHEHIDPSYLPEDYGGKLPKINYSSVEWYPVLRTLDDDFKEWNSFGVVEKK
ncbi:alpha-tocopherol transfer protein-like [Zootermopsis nevadensis]|uniref:alpha-tocopherol transfer protein-like n=1 Tax=Zootermopsis nevadensis TaxID=136037 RepID=UPI000B8E4596|nr:alpha-tocopherol transfer protein-like [Zootermopsis nevadensis]